MRAYLIETLPAYALNLGGVTTRDLADAYAASMGRLLTFRENGWESKTHVGFAFIFASHDQYQGTGDLRNRAWRQAAYLPAALASWGSSRPSPLVSSLEIGLGAEKLFERHVAIAVAVHADEPLGAGVGCGAASHSGRADRPLNDGAGRRCPG